MTDNDHVDLLEPPDETAAQVPYPPRIERWFELCQEYPYLRLLTERPWNESPPPRACTTSQLAPLVGSIFDEEHRALLRELLIELLAEDLEEIILAVLRREMQ